MSETLTPAERDSVFLGDWPNNERGEISRKKHFEMAWRRGRKNIFINIYYYDL